MADIVPGGIPSAEAHGSSKSKGVIRSWKPTNWRLEEQGAPRPIIAPVSILSGEQFGSLEFAYKIKNAGAIATAQAFGSVTLYEAGMYDWLLVDNAWRLPPDGAWQGAGVWYNASDPAKPWLGVKGIPNYPVGITMQTTNPANPYYVYGDGTHDDYAAIQAAINACSVLHAVLLPAGTFKLSAGLAMKTMMVLRGAGAGITKLTVNSTVAEVVSIYGTQGINPVIQSLISSGYTKGSDTIVVESATGFEVGEVVLIDELNDVSVPVRHGLNGTCTWCGLDDDNGTRARLESAIVENIAGNTITLHHPQYITRSAALLPRVTRLTRPESMLINTGVEDLSIVIVGGPSGTRGG